MTSVPSEPRVAFPTLLEGRHAAAALGTLGKNVAAAVATLAAATALLLGLLVLAPGDPIDLMQVDDAVRPQLAAELGLDRSLPARWALHARRLLSLDLGTSYVYRSGAAVADVIAGPARRTAGLVGAAGALACGLGTALAFTTAGRPRSAGRLLVGAVSLLPTFLVAFAAVWGLNELAWTGIGHGWWARPAWFALPDEDSAVRTALAVTVLAVASSTLSEIHGEIEDALVRVRASAWLDAARARGERTWTLVLRGLLPPVVAAMANRTGRLLGGAIVVEKVLLINGVGKVLWEAARLRDYELALSIAVLAATVVAAARLVADGLRWGLDPRLREAR
ncbi:MAG: ABC transporter permease [Myxococcota bacterium]